MPIRVHSVDDRDIRPRRGGATPRLDPCRSHRADLSCRLVALVVLVAGILLASLSCSPPEVAAGEPGERQPAAEGGRLRLVLEDPGSLDPIDADSVYASLPVNQLFDGLVASDPGMRIVPGLASGWTISRDGRDYTFHLRPGVTFHDGSPLTADDVVFTFQRLLAAEHSESNIASSYMMVVSGAREYAAGKRRDLPGVEAPDPLTVRIHLDRPYGSFLQVLALDGLRIVPRRLVERIGDQSFDRSPVGTGPFRLSARTSEHLLLAANPAYFNGRPHLDEVEIQFLAPGEKDAGAERFLRGGIDILEVPSEEVLDTLSADRGVVLHRYQELNLGFLGMVVRRPPLDDVRIRQAIAHAIDRDALVSDSPRTRRVATGILPPGLQGYSPKAKTLEHDPEAARRLLAEAGHPGGRGLAPIEFLTTSRGLAASRMAERIRADLGAVGIEVRALEVPWSELNRRIDAKTAAMFRISWVADVNDPDSFLRSLFEKGGSTNYFDFFDPATDEMLRAGERETNPVARDQIYRQAEERILLLAPIVPLYHPVNSFATRSYVREVEPGPMGIAMLNLEKAWFANGRTRR